VPSNCAFPPVFGSAAPAGASVAGVAAAGAELAIDAGSDLFELPPALDDGVPGLFAGLLEAVLLPLHPASTMSTATMHRINMADIFFIELVEIVF